MNIEHLLYSNFDIPLTVPVPAPCHSHIHPCNQFPPRPVRSNNKSLGDIFKTSPSPFPFASPIHASTPYHKHLPLRPYIGGTQTMRETSVTLRKGNEVYSLAFIIVPQAKKVIQKFDCPYSVDESNMPERCDEIQENPADESYMSE